MSLQDVEHIVNRKIWSNLWLLKLTLSKREVLMLISIQILFNKYIFSFSIAVLNDKVWMSI